jgi:hypothetical protein
MLDAIELIFPIFFSRQWYFPNPVPFHLLKAACQGQISSPGTLLGSI